MKYLLPLLLLIFATTIKPALAQASGQSTTVNIGIVERAERVTLKSSGSGKGAVVGGVVGYNVGSGKSKSRKRRNAIIGGAIGSGIASSGSSPGMQYTVKVGDGSAIVVVSDQLELKVGDCVSVEQVRDTANIRRQDPAACNPAVKEALHDLQDELIEDANECAAVKQELLNAKTIEEVELATLSRFA